MSVDYVLATSSKNMTLDRPRGCEVTPGDMWGLRSRQTESMQTHAWVLTSHWVLAAHLILSLMIEGRGDPPPQQASSLPRGRSSERAVAECTATFAPPLAQKRVNRKANKDGNRK